jgi:hypothetical protein
MIGKYTQVTCNWKGALGNGRFIQLPLWFGQKSLEMLHKQQSGAHIERVRGIENKPDMLNRTRKAKRLEGRRGSESESLNRWQFGSNVPCDQTEPESNAAFIILVPQSSFRAAFTIFETCRLDSPATLNLRRMPFLTPRKKRPFCK